MPVFPGGPNRFLDFLADSLHYPPLALRDRVQGKVYVCFTVDPTGSVTTIFVKQGLRADIDAEALRNTQRLIPIHWQPGTQNGRPVPVVYTVPLTFSIANPHMLAADSLDIAPGPTIVLPTSGWPASRGTLAPDKGLIYGSCVQRLGFSSGGMGQYVRLRNLDTDKVFRILVKPLMRSRAENEFCVALPPGRYALQQYEYSYGIESLRKASRGAVTDTRYTFVVLPGKLHYVGTWNFSALQKPRFTDDKAALDAQLSSNYSKLPFTDAVKTLPQ
ncbi:energy transducer TonB [Hymenobacter sp. GOD-10R]|uniref:energy transducer TonB n=1 Tax=Hymenobacter sp. GOD-10R TaxID=3093922 RepID=UPI002D7674E4|nr:energy transducer TonB [Hymenobacter sp. GOD-10R]WRQ27242.1 energy transducer TonB [Hymenobacter sp. GOD-10R]